MTRKNNDDRTGGDYPWSWLMYHALDLGVSAEAFWRMSPRAIVLLLREMRKSAQRQQSSPDESDDAPVRLNYIPRP